MVDLKLENDEGIIQQANSVELYKANDVYQEIYEMYLTNKNIICYYEKSNGFFAKSEEIIEKIPLSSIRVVDNKLQISKVDDDEYGIGLQILLQNGERVHFIFDKKKELQIWYDAILDTITRRKSESSTTDNKSIEKENSIVGSFLGVAQTVKDIAKDQIGELKDQIDDVKGIFIDKEEIDTISNNNVGEKLENNILSNNKEEKVKESMNSEEKKSIYCSNCGEKLIPNSKFCNYCGTPTENTKNEKNIVEEKKNEASSREELTERKMVYDGKIHKCPNCGEVLESFIKSCPSCGYEIREMKNSLSLNAFVEKLQEIEYSRPQENKRKRITDDPIDKTDKKIISLIRNFPIPNTKEDLLEFIILASSNINLESYNEFGNSNETDKAVSDAWESKFVQAYEKAKIILDDSEELKIIQDIYDKRKTEIKKAKRTNLYSIIGFCFIILLIGIGSLVGVIIFNKNNTDSTNNNQTDNISIIENKDNNTSENNNETKTESKTSVSIGDNIVVNNNEYIEIKEVGYTRSSSFLTCIVTILNNSNKAIEFPAFRVTAYNKDGNILSTEERVLSLLYPNSIIVDDGTLMEISEEPDKIEVTMLETDEYKVKDVSTLEHPEYKEMKCQNISVNSNKITGEVYNPNDYKMETARVTVVFRDEKNKIVNSESTFISDISANGKIPFDISLPSDAKVTEKFEVTACIW